VEENTNEIYSSGMHSVHISQVVKQKCDCRKCVLHLLNSGPHRIMMVKSASCMLEQTEVIECVRQIIV